MKIRSHGKPYPIVVGMVNGNKHDVALPLILARLTIGYHYGLPDSEQSAKIAGAIAYAKIFFDGIKIFSTDVDGKDLEIIEIEDAEGDAIRVLFLDGEFRYEIGGGIMMALTPETKSREFPKNDIPAFMVGHPVELD